MIDSTNWTVGAPWSHRQQGDKWVVGKWQTERMKIHANGDVSLGKHEELVSELYEFETEWAAASHARFCNRIEPRPPQVPTYGVLDWSGERGTSFCVGNREVWRVLQGGQVERFDLPYFVWAWLRTSALARGLKAFWYGWGK